MPASVDQFEQIVLTAILSLRDDAYGVSIHHKAADLLAPKGISPGVVYITLDRLEDKGFIASWLADPTPERGGRPRRYYKLTAAGQRAAMQQSVAVAGLFGLVPEVAQ